MKTKISLLAFFTSLFVCVSCKRESADFNQSITINGQNKTKDGFPNYSFNWETATQMMPSSTNPTYNPTMPWSSQSGSYIDPAIIGDYKSSDGWVLVYNTFNPTNNEYLTNAASGGLYFALYNVYRGILRYYLYIPSGQFGGGVNIQHGLSIYSSAGNTTSMLNFEGADIVDANAKVAAFTKTGDMGVAQQGGWYAMQYEIAYDPNFSSASFPSLGIAWNSQTVNISKIELQGSQVGSITGNITQQSSGFNWAGTLINLALGAAEIYASGGLSTLTSANTITQLNTAAASGLAGNATGFLSGIFGGNSNNPQEVDLKMSTTISLAGTETSTNELSPNTFVFPGESIAQGNPSYPPLYTSPLGVFNLTARPIVYVHTTPAQFTLNGDRTYNGANDVFTVDPNLLSKIVYNSAVTRVATIKVLKTDLLISPTITSGTWNGTLFGGSWAGTESFGSYYELIRNPSFVQQEVQTNSGWVGNTYVRLVLQVTPNNGAPASTIVKTFLANVVQD